MHHFLITCAFIFASFFIAKSGVPSTYTHHSPAFHAFDVDSGISHLSVADFAQDKHGFLWIASQSGVDRFDGYTFKYFGKWKEDKSTGLPTLTALQVESSQDGQYIWIGGFSGLSRINVDTETFDHFSLPSSDSFSTTPINRIKRTSDGKLWFVAERGLYQYSESIDGISYVASLPSSTSTLTDLALVGNTVYVSTTSGLYKLDTIKKKLQFVGFKGANLTRIVTMNKKKFTLGTTDYGICFIETNKIPTSLQNACISEKHGLTANYVNDILLHSTGEIWVATEKGVNAISSSLQSTVNVSLSEKNKLSERISRLYRTDSNLIVVGTKDNGFLIGNPLTSNFNSRDIEDGRIISSLSSTGGAEVWLTAENGLWLYDTESQKIKGPFNTSGFDDEEKGEARLLSVFYDKLTQNVWVSTRTGLAKLNKKEQKLDIVALEGKSGYTLSVDDEGDIWYGGYSDGVFIYRPSEDRVVRQWPLSLTTRILLNSRNKAWLSTVTGLFFADKKTGDLIDVGDYTDAFDDQTVVTWISESRRGGFWIGTQSQGLFFLSIEGEDFNTLKVTQIKPESRISDISIGAIVEDEDYSLWISTIEGIAYLSPDLSKFSYFGTEHGASSMGYYIGAVATTPSNTILFGGSQGITEFQPADIFTSPWQPNVRITSVEIISKDESNGSMRQRFVDVTKPITLSPNDISFSIEFASLDFINADEIRYAYKLADFESNWRYSSHKKRVATYTNLDPGYYRFTVKAINKDNEWSSEQAQLEITIIPPWYDEPMWRGILLLCILSIAFFFVWMRIASLKSRSVELALKVDEKTKDLEAVVEKLTLISTQDALTGLKNRRYFTERAQEAWQAYKRHNHIFSLLIVDIDFFKRINDEFGHLVGDAVLTQIASLLTDNLREGDIIARWGGEEFLVLLPSLNNQEAYWVAEKLRKKIADTPLSAPPHVINSTITCGVADIRGFHSVEACIHAVDKKLYKGKASGRNAVIQ